MEQNNRYTHPMAKELNELERIKREARANNDIASYKKAQTDIEQIIRANPAMVSEDELNSMSPEEKASYYQTKINESKILHDEASYNLWNSRLKELESKKEVSAEETKEDYYVRLMDAINKRRSGATLTDEDKKQIIGEIYYNIDYLIANANTEEEIMDLVTKVVTDLGNDDFEKSIQSQIMTGIQEKLGERKREITNDKPKEELEVKSSSSNNIEQIRIELKKLQREYHNMLDDGHIDDDELAVLIKRMNELSKDAGSMMHNASQNERQILSMIVSNIDDELKKMKNVQAKVTDLAAKSR